VANNGGARTGGYQHGGVAALQRGVPTLTEETSLNTDTGVRWRSDWRLAAQFHG